MSYRAPLAVPVPTELRKDVLGKLWYVSESLAALAFGDESGRDVVFDLRTPDDAEATVVAGRIAGVAQRMLDGFRPVEERVLVDRTAAAVGGAGDPQAALEAAGEALVFGPGRVGLGPLPCRLLEVLAADLRRLARALEARPHRFPTLIGADTLERCRYIESFPHALTVAAHLREDLDGIQAFAREARVQSGHLVADPQRLAPSECLLSPAVCFHLYAWLTGTRLASPRVVSADGKCFRYESGNLAGLRRLWDFTMTECVAVGSQAEVLAFRERALAQAVELLDAWGLAYQVHTATDPFFVDAFAKQASYQAAFELKFEASAVLPYRGDRLAIASFNYHQDFFGRSFDITAPDGRPAHTSCIGFGLERFVLAFLAQHGPAPAGWPERIRSRYAEAAGW